MATSRKRARKALIWVISAEIKAGKPYIIVWESGENIVNPTFNNVTITEDEASASTKSGGVQFCGTFIPYTVTGGDKGIMFVGLGGALNWPSEGGNINGFRSYFTVDLSTGSPFAQGMRSFLVEGDGTTGIEATETEVVEKVKKLIEGGKVIIISNGVKYDINGQKITEK